MERETRHATRVRRQLTAELESRLHAARIEVFPTAPPGEIVLELQARTALGAKLRIRRALRDGSPDLFVVDPTPC